MYAVIKTGGKQYKVAKNDVILVERLPGEAGATVELDEVLLVGDDKGQTVGSPRIEGAVVEATLLEQTRGDKIIVFKKKRRQNYRRKNGHRQDLTALRITEIVTGGRKKAAKAEAPKAAAPKAEPKKAEAPVTKAKAEAPATKAKAKAEVAAPKAKAAAPAKKAAPKKAAAESTEAKKAPAKKPAAKKPAAKKD